MSRIAARPMAKAQPASALLTGPARRQPPPSSSLGPAPGPRWSIGGLPVQTKLTIGAVDDPLEREADRVAAQVMVASPPEVRRKCAACAPEERAEALQQKQASLAESATREAPPIVHEVLRSPGQPLDAATRNFFEPRLAHEFSHVRVHSDVHAAESAQAVGARAYTRGEHVVFNSGQFMPQTLEGRKLLAHELTHTIQQAPHAKRLPEVDAPNSDADEDGNTEANAVAIGRSFEVEAGGASEIARQAAPDGGAAPACANPGDGRHVTLQPVFLRTDASDAAPTGGSWSRRFGPSNTIWNKLGVNFAGSSPVTVDAGALKNGGDSQADRNAIRALWTGSGVGVYFVKNDMPSVGGGGTAPGGGGAPVISDNGASTTLLAHELGHTLGLKHPPTGADDNTVMTPSGSIASDNPTRNTLGNYNRITWPAGDSSTCLNPDS
jgi:hypothetical protein